MLTIITKCTEYCNANCVYCAVRDKESKREQMTVGVLRQLLERVAEYLQVDPLRRVNITWHGGEPLLMGAEFYRAAGVLHQEILGRNAPRLRHTMQSNITLLTQELVAVLRELGLDSIGSSYDYTPGLRGIGPDRNHEEYSRRFFKGVELLHRNGISTGIIFVVTSQSVKLPVETLVYMCNLLGKKYRGHIRLNPLYREGEASREMAADLAVTPEEFGHFLGSAYRYWLPRRSLLEGIAPFSAITRAVAGDSSRLSCEEAGRCGNTHLAVGPRGQIFQCGRAMDNASLQFGTLADHSFEQVFEHPMKRELVGRTPHLEKNDCRDCPIWRYCHGGCPVDSIIYHQDWLHKTYFCRTKQVFLGEYVIPLLQATRSSDEKEVVHADPNIPRAY